MSEAEIVPVTQADRDASGELWREFNGDDPHPNDGTAAEYLEATAIAFARHRLAAEAAAIEKAAQVAESHASSPAGVPVIDYDVACHDCAEAIRSLKEGASHVG